MSELPIQLWMALITNFQSASTKRTAFGIGEIKKSFQTSGEKLFFRKSCLARQDFIMVKTGEFFYRTTLVSKFSANFSFQNHSQNSNSERDLKRIRILLRNSKSEWASRSAVFTFSERKLNKILNKVPRALELKENEVQLGRNALVINPILKMV